MLNGATREISDVELNQRLETACRGRSKVQVLVYRWSLRMKPVGAWWKAPIGATREEKEAMFAGD